MRARFAVMILALSATQTLAAPAKPAAPPPPALNVPLTITLYDKENFQGRSVKVSAATPNLAALQIEDKVASFEVAGAGDWVLCADRNYKGVCARVTAKAGDLRVIQLFGRVSSLYPVPAPLVPAAPAGPAAPR
jgi:Beta/Gamma crystallin